MKRVLAIGLLLLFCFGFSGVLVLLGWQQIEIRREVASRIKRGIPDAELQAILMHPANAAEFDWENAAEFEFRGNRFDVVRKKVLNDSVTLFYCLNDSLERRVLQGIRTLIRKAPGHDKASELPTLKTHGFYSLLPPQGATLALPPVPVLPMQFRYACPNYSPPAINIVAPPPRSS